jgi:tetraacyldisaccharide 4'-kinase
MASIGFLPAEGLFRWTAAARNRLFDLGLFGVVRADVPVLSVGNLTVGGTGKTPLVGWFVAQLAAGGAGPAVVARGYGRDELMLHRRWHPGLPVIGDRDRVAGVRRAVEEGADLAVLDDGFQHRRLHRDLDVVLVAAETPFPGRRLPRGPYREGPGALRRADLAVVTRKTAAAADAEALARRIRALHPGLSVARVALRSGGWKRLDGSSSAPPSGPVIVLTAVAEPEGVRALAASALGTGSEDAVPLEAFPDHHEFSDAEIRRVTSGGRALVVTEKDAVKLAEHAAALASVSVHVLTLDVVWEEGEADARAAVDRLLEARK